MRRHVPIAVLAFAIAALFATPASAALQRDYESSFGAFTAQDPRAITVDQSNGDLYVIDTGADTVSRFNSAGLPKDFTAGPNAGTNTLTGLGFQNFQSLDQVAVDNSGGPSDGNIYVTQSGSGQVKVFAQSGEPLGSLNGSGTAGGSLGEVCGAAVDQANGDLYLASFGNRIWRYSPSGATVIEGDYSGGLATSIEPCQLAVAQGSLYAHHWKETPSVGIGPVRKYATTDFATGSPPSPSSTQVADKAFAIATDPSNGDLYVDEGNKVSVYGSTGTLKYSFGSGDFGSSSGGVAVRSGGEAYVSDPSAHEIDVYGTTLEPGDRAPLFSFGAFTAQDPRAITVDQSNGDLYVIDTGADTVSRFDSAGLPKDFTAGPDAGTNTLTGLGFQNFPSLDQVAIDNSGGPSDGNIYVTQSGSGEVKVFASSGEPLGSLNGSGTAGGSLGEVCGAAVDQANGDLYLASFGNRIWRYSPSGATVIEGDYSGGLATSIEPCQLAVAQGSLYAHHWKETPSVGIGPVRKYATTDFATGSPPSPSSTQVADKAFAIATDPSNGDLYVDEGDKVSVYGSTGTLKYSFGSGDFGSLSAGVGVRVGGNAYVSDPTNHRVDVYGPFSAPPPIVETEAATGVKHVKATLHGHLDPNDSLPITGCSFEWGTDTSYGEAPVPCAEGGAFNAPADVSAELTGLTPGTTYHFRLHVTTGSGGFDGEDESFEAIPASSTPEVVTGKGTILSSSSSELKGTVNPNANPITDCRFEYVTDLAIQATGFNDLSSGGSVPCDQAPGSIPADFEEHEVTATLTGLDPEQVYRFRLVAENAGGSGNGGDALVPGPPLVETTGSTYRTTTTARLDSRVSPHGADATYHFEYVTDAEFGANGFANAVSTPDAPFDLDEIQIVEVLGSPGERFKLSFGGFTTPELTKPVSAEAVQAALRALPSIGSPNVHVTSGGEFFTSTYTVTFDGGPLADTDVDQIVASPGTPPPASGFRVRTIVSGGAGAGFSFVSAEVGGLQPATTYHYRLIADNGNPDGPTFGEEMRIDTRASDAPLDHGALPGPPDSDRAWEQVNVPDTGGNPVQDEQVLGFSDDGNRALYSLQGGSPGSQIGSFETPMFAERTPEGWKGRLVHPTRDQAPWNKWSPPVGPSDLSRFFTSNRDTTGEGTADIWLLSPDAPAEHVYGLSAENTLGFTAFSDDGSRALALLTGNLDPDHPVTAPEPRDRGLYDVTSGSPRLVSLLPDGSVPTCGVREMPVQLWLRAEHWISADGSLAFFYSAGSGDCIGLTLYVRDLEAETTTEIAPGFSTAALFIRSTADAAFFTNERNLVPEDEGGRDVYRYGLEDASLDCLTCLAGLRADVAEVDSQGIAISDDGSRLYFISPHRLLPGAADRGIYRVGVSGGDLAYVAPATDFSTTAGTWNRNGNGISPDGSVFVFRSADPGLDSLNGPQNGDSPQYYRYDDEDRSLVCVSCPVDGGAPRGGVDRFFAGSIDQRGANLGAISSAGDLAFTTPSPLVSGDQNTARNGQDPVVGTDVYEWRDGRLLLVTDGVTITVGNQIAGRPRVAGITPDGRNIFFVQFAQLTPDAIDPGKRLYDARIGGGFEFPTPPPPCALEACQGTPRGVPEEPRPGSLDFTDNTTSPSARCRKGKVRRRGRCVAKKHKRAKRSKHRANDDRRAGR